MNVVITGGLGFLGQRLAAALLDRGTLAGSSGSQETLSTLVLFDHVAPEAPPFADDKRVRIVVGDIADRAIVDDLIDNATTSVFHLASIVSGEGERDFDAAMRVNLDGGLNVLEAMRARQTPGRLVATSSLAGYGGTLPDVVDETTRLTPQTTYGTTKVMLELLINDYARKGFVDGRTARLPTVIVRPGKPNAAASSFFSGVFREPLQGKPCAVPLAAETKVAVTGYRAVIDDLITLHDVPAADLGTDRAVGFPAINVSVRDMIDAVERAGGAEARAYVSMKQDAAVAAIVSTWPQALHANRASALGLTETQSLDGIVSDYMDDYGNAAIKARSSSDGLRHP